MVVGDDDDMFMGNDVARYGGGGRVGGAGRDGMRIELPTVGGHDECISIGS